MRHRQSGRKLNRNSAHRTAMFRNMTASLVRHELIKTTLVKAKELRGVAEPLITLARQDSVANRRLAFSRVRDRAAVGKLFAELGPRYADRPGGYIRILKCGLRPGDKAPMAYVELVDRPQQDAMDYEDDMGNTDREALPPEEMQEDAPEDSPKKADKKAKAMSPSAGLSKAQPKTKAKQAAGKATRKSAARKRG